jgi:hypothetical protein
VQFRQVVSDELATLRSNFIWAKSQIILRRLLVVSAILFTIAIFFGTLGPILRDTGVIGPEADFWLSVGRDGSIVETLGYCFFGAATFLLLLIYQQTGRPLVLLLAVLVGYLLIDDMFMLHDQARVRIGNFIGFENSVFGKEDFGELVFALFALFCATCMFATFRQRIKFADVMYCLPVIGGVALFLSLAVGLDQIHQIASHLIDFGRIGDPFFSVLEDGGELAAQGLTMLASSALCLKLVQAGALQPHQVTVSHMAAAE